MSKPEWQPYVDRGGPGLRYDHDGKLPLVREPPAAPEKTIKALPPAAEGADAHAALERWAHWVRDSLAGTGWPEKTLLARVIEYGALGAAQGHHGSLVIVGTMVEYDELCGWVEAAVMRLDILERNVIVRHYLHWEPAETAARSLGVNAATFRQRLSRARRSVKDYLDGRRAALV